MRKLAIAKREDKRLRLYLMVKDTLMGPNRFAF